MTGKLLIIGAGGHGRVIADIAKKTNKYTDIAFLDDDRTVEAAKGYELLGSFRDIDKYLNSFEILVAIGKNKAREEIQSELEKKGAKIPILIHPSAIIGESVAIATGTVIMAGVVINYGSVIGKGCIINTAAVVDHDGVLEDYVHISPGASIAGTVKIGRSSWIGTGATVSNNINICNECTVGAGAVVVKDLTIEGVYTGVPARRR